MSLITISEAQKMISLYKTKRQEILSPGYSTDILPFNITLPASEVQSLIKQGGCASVRVYFGMQQENDLIDVILVGVDADGKDIIPEENYIIVDRGDRCPVICPPPSIINS